MKPMGAATKNIELRLQATEATQQAPLCADADTVLELLYNTYYEHVSTDDTDEIKQAFDDLYHSTTGKTLKEKDEIIDAVCNLCRLHQHRKAAGWPACPHHED